MLRVADLKQWAYCRRIVYYQHRMPGAAKATHKMGEGKSAQEMIERLEVRRTLQQYGLEHAQRRFGVWLEEPRLGPAGKLDLILEGPNEAAVVDFKLTSGEVGENHRAQLAGYAVLAEAILGKAVPRGFVYRIPDGMVFPLTIGNQLRQRVKQSVLEIRELLDTGWLPDRTEIKKRCAECEYANYCGDVW